MSLHIPDRHQGLRPQPSLPLDVGGRPVRVLALMGLASVAVLTTACDTKNVGTAPAACVLTISASPSSMTIERFASQSITASGTKSADCGTVSRQWSSNNPGVAAVSGSGVVTGIAAGNATITVRARDETDGTMASANIAVTVTLPVTVAINAAPSSLDLGASQQLTATVTGASQAVTWMSSAPGVVAITPGGLANAQGVGQATLTATSTAAPTKSASVTMNVAVAVAVSPVDVGLEVGNSQQLSALVTGAVDKSVTWSSGDLTVATVSQAGVVSATGVGSTTITATSVAAPTRKGSATVTITGPANPVLEHRWTFSETGGAGTQLIDDVGGAHGAIVAVGNNPAMVQSGRVMLTGGAHDESDYVALPAGLLSNRASATIEVWGAMNAVQSWARIFDIGSGPSSNLFMSWTTHIQANNDRAEWLVVGKGRSTLDGTMAPYVAGTEYQIVMTIEAGAGTGGTTLVQWYRDGQFRGSFETTLTLADLQDANAWIGRSNYPADFTASATYNEVRIYNGAMSAQEVLDRFNAGPVDDIPVVASIELTLSQSTVNVGQQVQATAIARDASNAVIPAAAITFSTSDVQVAVVSPTGLVSTIGAGGVTIRASAGAILAQVQLFVVGVPSPTQSTITVSPYVGVPPTPCTLVADAYALCTIRIAALTSGGAPVPGATVNLTVSGGGVVVTQPTTVTDEFGQLQAQFAATLAGVKTVSATIGGVAIVQQVNVTASYPTSCAQISRPGNVTGIAAAPSGIYNIDVDGGGPLAPFSAYCDQTFDGGGWTLILDSNGLGTGSLAQASQVQPNSAGTYMSGERVAALTAHQSQVHIRTAGAAATTSITSVPNALPIQNLRMLQAVNSLSAINSAAVSAGVVASEWTGPLATASQLWGSLGAGVAYPVIYWSFNNFTGLHLNAGNSCWVPFCLGTDLEVYVR